MIDISFAGLLGAVIGTAMAALAYAPLLAAIERRLCTRSGHTGAPENGIDRGIMRQEISLLRRGVFAADIAVFAGLGYWLAATLANR